MKTTTILLFAIILNACGASDKAASKLSEDAMKNTQESLNGTFKISGIDAKNATKDLIITFDEANSKVSGFSGCNTFFGSYIANGNTITFNGLASTRKMCADKNSNLAESKIMAALGVTTNLEIKDDKLVLLNAKKELLTATKVIDTKMTENYQKIEYKSLSRGSFNEIVLENKKISVKNGRSSEPVLTACNDRDWSTLQQKISEIDLKTLTALEAPSKAHQYDGAAIGSFSITKDGETYSVPTFDAGNPNEKIKDLVNLVIKIADATKEKN